MLCCWQFILTNSMVYDASEMGIAMTTTGDQEASCLGSSRWLSVSVVSGTRKQRPTAACALSQDSDAWIFNMFQMLISRIFLVYPRWMSQAKAPGDATSGWQLFSGTLKRKSICHLEEKSAPPVSVGCCRQFAGLPRGGTSSKCAGVKHYIEIS